MNVSAVILQAVGHPGVNPVPALLALGRDEVSVVDHEGQPEPLLHLALPLPYNQQRTGDNDAPHLLAHQQFAKDQSRLDGLPQPDVVGDEEVDPRHGQRLPQRLELEGPHFDPSPVGILEDISLRCDDTVPPQRVQVS